MQEFHGISDEISSTLPARAGDGASPCSERFQSLNQAISVAIETSGYAAPEVYRRVVPKTDFVYQDLKHWDADLFRKWPGGDLGIVFDNIAWLKDSGVEYKLRVPLIPGVNDSPADRKRFAALIGDSPVEYLPYNPGVRF